MSKYIQYNANPSKKRVGDCTVRAISKALGQSWDETFLGIVIYGYMLCDMPSADHVWGAYLRSRQFERKIIPNEMPDGYTVRHFCEDHPKGSYILAISGHVVAVESGHYFDTWDSGDECPIYYWERKENE